MNTKYEKLVKNPKTCRRLFGLDFDKLESLLEKVQLYFEQKQSENPISNRGLKTGLGLKDQFLLTLTYLRTYKTFIVLGFEYGVSESWANKIYHRHLEALGDILGLKNPAKLSRRKVRKVLLDVTCQPVEKPQDTNLKTYNGQKKNM